MAKAFQCDRCGKLVAGETNKLVGQYTYKNKELCDECFEEYEMFMDGATLGLSDDTVRKLFNTLNEAWAFNEKGNEDLHVRTCNNCYHRNACGCASAYSDADQCKKFVSNLGIIMGAEKRLKLTKAVEECLKILDENAKS